MAELSGGGRFIKLSSEERSILISLEGQKRDGIKIAKWEKGNISRLYINIDHESSYIDLKDENDLELGFRHFTSGPAIVALLEKIAQGRTPAPVVEIEAPEAPVVAPTTEEVNEASGAIGFGASAATEDGEFIAIGAPATAANIRLLQIKAAWQHIVVTPIFKALPLDEQHPWKWNEICLTLDPEWAVIEEMANSDLVSWADHVAAFKQGVALRAVS